mmetsp:Transcript_6382/g.18968  ORF Transcript_6382/g.18968 Transcript_6382/m.18968 type:complete len:404 (+) Transcript_6382:24-1235(+)
MLGLISLTSSGALLADPVALPSCRGATRSPPSPVLLAAPAPNRRDALAGAALAGASLAATPTSAQAAAKAPTWAPVQLPLATEAPILFDIEFDEANPKNGFIVGNKGTFLQTTDGGSSWQAKSFANLDPDEEINYRFTKMSFRDGEGWIIGKPAILLHTRDSGASWERVPLSPKLPGDPYNVVALGPGKAEMSTSAGAIYTTDNSGRNWKAQVRETIDATLNRVSSSGVQGASYFSGSINDIQRDADGSYLAVSSRGNFYLTYRPGDEFWIPHNRGSSRRITSMGFVKSRLADGLWMSTAGGEISKTTSGQPVDTQLIDIPFDRCQIKSGGYGILDVLFLKDSNKAWAVGGGGTIFGSTDGGRSWQKDKSADDLPTNLYKIKSFSNGRVYILGSNGVLLSNTA